MVEPKRTGLSLTRYITG